MENGNEVSVALELSEQDGDPYWTKTGSWTMGLDPLGLQATSIRIYQSLVPNITNITVHQPSHSQCGLILAKDIGADPRI